MNITHRFESANVTSIFAQVQIDRETEKLEF